MGRYIVKRILMMILVFVGVSFIVFFITDLAPGDAADLKTSSEMTVQEVEALREEMGLNRNVFIRYLEYIWDMLHGNLGESYFTGKPVFKSFLERFPATLLLATSTTLLAAVVSIPLGIYSAKHRGSIADSMSMLIALLGLSMPPFFIGLILIIVFSLNLNLLPSGGYTGLPSLIMPSISAAACMLAIMTRTTRSSMLDALSMDYLDLARAKGVSEKNVVNKHAFKNALIPVVTIVGNEFAASLGGCVIVEKLFSWPGVGAFIVDGVSNRDIPVVCGCVTLVALFTTIVQLIVDILFAYIDPRIRAKYAKQAMHKMT